MTFSIGDFHLKKIFNYADWKLLLFLMLFLNVKLEVKLIAIVIIYLLRFNFKFGFSLKNSRLPLFYLLITGIAVLGLIVNLNFFNPHYLVIFFIGIFFWLLCILAIHQVKLAVEHNEVQTLHQTILLFFVINAIVSFFSIALIIHETGAINPYRYQGNYQKYFIGTGDYIMGLTFDTSTTNAVLCAFGVIYFLTRNNIAMALINMMVLLLTGSNYVDLALLVVFTLLFAFRSTKNQKSVILACFMLLVIFMAKVSPQNDNYVVGSIADLYRHPVYSAAVTTNNATLTASLSPDEVKQKIARQYIDSVNAVSLSQKKSKIGNAYATASATTTNVSPLPIEKGRIVIAGPDINTPPYQTPTDTTFEERRLLAFISSHKTSLPLSSQMVFEPSRPGKVTGFMQTVAFFFQHPAKILTGEGIGNAMNKGVGDFAEKGAKGMVKGVVEGTKDAFKKK